MSPPFFQLFRGATVERLISSEAPTGRHVALLRHNVLSPGRAVRLRRTALARFTVDGLILPLVISYVRASRKCSCIHGKQNRRLKEISGN